MRSAYDFAVSTRASRLLGIGTNAPLSS
jgi:hypothetical protein